MKEFINKFINKIKNNKKLVSVLVSMIVVIVVLINSTYSLLIRNDETDLQSYGTGMLEITSEASNNSVTLTNSLPVEDSVGVSSTPYTFTITNTGNLAYTFDVKLLSMTLENQIDAQYIKVKVDDGEVLTLSNLTGGTIKEDVTLYTNQSIEITVRVWLAINTPNTQIGKTFDGKIVTEGYAVYYEENKSLATLTILGLDDEVRTDELNFVEGSSEEDTGIYIAEDDIGTSYYFRGNVTNNYVKFGKYTEDAWLKYNYNTGQSTYGTSCTGGSNIQCTKIASVNDDMYWRIVRINGDGSIRMMYAGTSAHDNGVARESIGNSAYNINYADNAYVGYMYGTPGSSTYADTHANINNSTIKTTIDNWYSKYLNANYSQYIVDAIYCNDRKVVTDDSKYKALSGRDNKVAGNGIGTSYTMYGAWARMESYEDSYSNLSAINPTLKCEQVNDRFTKIGSTITTIDNQGTNQKLTYPVGLLTADETIFAGGTYLGNNNYYLYIASGYWTMSPSFFYDDNARAFEVYGGSLDPSGNSFVDTTNALFPAISLSSTAITGGLGTAISPFTVSS